MLLNQKDYVYEICVSDDCSTDNTIQVIENYQKRSALAIQLLKNEVNSGPSKSRYSGIAASHSEYICFCDSDDWYDTDYFQEMVSAQKENNADVVYCSFRLVIGSGKIIERLNKYEADDLEGKKRVLIKAPDSLCVMMIRRSIILGLPHPDMRHGEDMALIPLIVSNSNSFSAVNKCMYNYYCRDNSASMKPSMKMIESLEQSFSFIQEHLNSDYLEEKEFIGIRNLLYGALINLFKFSYDKNKANQIVNGFESSFPMWHCNHNICELPITKRFFLKCVHKRYWFVAKTISIIHGLLLK